MNDDDGGSDDRDGDNWVMNDMMMVAVMVGIVTTGL